MTKFRIDETFALESVLKYVLGGEIIEGVVKSGMFIQIPFNDQIRMTAAIHGVEFIDRSGRTTVGLTVKVQDADELQLWRDLRLVNQVVEISTDAA
jgi:hypothetical protein